MKQLILTISLLGCMAESQFTSDEDNTNTKTTSGDKQGECSKETCTVEMAEGEKLLSDLSIHERQFLQTEILAPQVVVKMPEIWQKRFDYLNTYLKFDKRQKPNEWIGNFSNSAGIPIESIRFNDFTGLPKAYADGAGNNAHLPITSPIQMPWIKDKTSLYYPAIGLVRYPFPLALLTYDAVDYFANDKCPATVTGQIGYASEGGYFKATFPNGNEITVLPEANKSITGGRNINFWVGRDKNLKMVYEDKSSIENYISTTRFKFATFAECGVRMPEHDYECKVVSKVETDGIPTYEGSICP